MIKSEIARGLAEDASSRAVLARLAWFFEIATCLAISDRACSALAAVSEETAAAASAETARRVAAAAAS